MGLQGARMRLKCILSALKELTLVPCLRSIPAPLQSLVSVSSQNPHLSHSTYQAHAAPPSHPAIAPDTAVLIWDRGKLLIRALTPTKEMTSFLGMPDYGANGLCLLRQILNSLESDTFLCLQSTLSSHCSSRDGVRAGCC